MYRRVVAALILVSTAIQVTHTSTIHNSHDSRIIHKEVSHLDHEVAGSHNEEYDHEAFLGKELDEKFHHFSMEQSMRELRLIAGKIDSDNDGYISESEMIKWIKYIQRKYDVLDSRRVWQEYEKLPSETMSWQEYDDKTFGELTEVDYPEKGELEKQIAERNQDFRRFKMADKNFDGKLDSDEFIAFLHPEDTPHMMESVVMDTIEDLDTDGDGYISLSEYTAGDDGGDDNSISHGKEATDFEKWRDLNQDGRLDHNEVQRWIYPLDYDSAVAESKHLIHKADADNDGRLSYDEVTSQHQLFVGSQATSYGNALRQTHDTF